MRFHSDWIDRNVYYRQVYNEEEKCPHFKQYERPVIVCLCGSTRFMTAFYDANMRETLAGKIVLSVGMSSKGDCAPTEDQKIALDALHCLKIDLADEILVLNVDGYVGDSTRREVLHAEKGGKMVRWLEPFKVPPDLAHVGDSLCDGPKVHRDSDNDPDKIGY